MLRYRQRPAVIKIIDFSHRHRWSKYLCVGAVSAIYAYDCANEFIYLSGERAKEFLRSGEAKIPSRLLSGVTAAAFAVMSVPFGAAAEGFSASVSDLGEGEQIVADSELPRPNLTPDEYNELRRSLVASSMEELPASSSDIIFTSELPKPAQVQAAQAQAESEETAQSQEQEQSEAAQPQTVQSQPDKADDDGTEQSADGQASDDVKDDNDDNKDGDNDANAASSGVGFADNIVSVILGDRADSESPEDTEAERAAAADNDAADDDGVTEETVFTGSSDGNRLSSLYDGADIAAETDAPVTQASADELTDTAQTPDGTESSDEAAAETSDEAAAETSDETAAADSGAENTDNAQAADSGTETAGEALYVTVAGLPASDSRYSVELSFEEGALSGNVTVELKKGTKKDHAAICSAFEAYSVNPDTLNIVPFRLALYDGNGANIDPGADDTAEVVVPMPASMREHHSDLRIISFEGSYIDIIDSEYLENEDGSLSIRFITNRFSVFAVVAYSGDAENIESSAGGFADADISVSVSGLSIPDAFPERKRRSEKSRSRKYRIVRRIRKKDIIF